MIIIYLKIKKNTKRKYDFIFVGKFIHRKNLDILLKSFKKIKKIYKNSNLLLFGGNNIKSVDGIKVLPHINSRKIANLMNDSKCLVYRVMRIIGSCGS